MSRYQFLGKDHVYDALNKLRAAFLAARNGSEVENIIKGLLTYDERMKLGRRIAIAQMREIGMGYEEIETQLKVGRSTITAVEKTMLKHPKCFDLINQREEKVEREYRQKAYRSRGSSSLIRKPKEYTGFKRKDVAR